MHRPGPGGGRYRLTLPPGGYRIIVPVPGAQPRLVTVRPGVTVTVSFEHTCLL